MAIDFNPVPDLSGQKSINLGGYGSPEYNQAMLDWLRLGVNREAQQAANSRGILYSGPAIDAASRAEADLAMQVASQAAQANREERLIKEAAERNRQLQREQANAQIKSSAIGGGAQALGMLGAYGLMNKNPVSPADAAYDRLSDARDISFANKGGYSTSNPAAAGIYNQSVAGGADKVAATKLADSTLPWYAHPLYGTSQEMLGRASTPTNMASGALGGAIGSQLGGGGGTRAQVGSALGGLGTYLAASKYSGSPLVGGLGALAGSAFGKQIGEGLGKLFGF